MKCLSPKPPVNPKRKPICLLPPTPYIMYGLAYSLCLILSTYNKYSIIVKLYNVSTTNRGFK